MKASIVFASILFTAVISNAKSLECEYSAFDVQTGENSSDNATVSMPILPDEEGAQRTLRLGKFGSFNAYAWQYAGHIVVAADEPTTKMSFSSAGEGAANLRLQTSAAIYEVFCKIVP